MASHMGSEAASWSRRRVLAAGLACSLGAALPSRPVLAAPSTIRIPPFPDDRRRYGRNGFSPISLLRDFDYGTLKTENGRTVREFNLTADSHKIYLNRAISFVSWSVNGRVPGPTLRVKEGDRVRVIFNNQDGHSHTLHFHGTHPAEMDGVKPVRHGKQMVYEFDAEPHGVHLYHCHVPPVTRHVSKGLYGMFIVDPPEGRPPADEMVLVMGGYDLKTRERNDIYAFNGIPYCYRNHPIPIYQNQLVRLYLLNMIEFDPAVTFHIHANMFDLYRTGYSLTPDEHTDVVTMGTAERHILEFSYPYTGEFMFHPHQDLIAEHGCMGKFRVLPA